MMQRSIFTVVVLGYSLVFFVQLQAQDSPLATSQGFPSDDQTINDFDSKDENSGFDIGQADAANIGDVDTQEALKNQQNESVNDSSIKSHSRKIPETSNFSYKDIGIQGNNVKQKEWVKQAHQIFNQIQDFSVKIEASRSIFNQKFNVIDDELDKFYKEYGVQQGKQDELFVGVLNFLEKKKQRLLAALLAERQQDKIIERDFKSRVEEVEAEIKKHKTQLDQLRFNMKSIEELDNSIGERITRLDEQITSSKKLLEQGGKIVDFMWNIIDDTIAKAQYYELVNNVFAPMQAIHNYLTIDLQGDFDRTADMIRRQIAKVLSETSQLEATGLVLVNRSNRIDEIRQQVKSEREKALQEEKEQEQKRKEALELKKKAAQKKFGSWYRRIFYFFNNLVSQFFSWIHSFLGGSSSKIKASSISVEGASVPPPVSM